MWRLVIECGGDSCQVGLMRGEEAQGGWRWDWPRQHAERLVWMASEILSVEKLSWRDIEGVAVMIGPGSHTGLRVGLAAAKAWALRWGWVIYPVPLLRVVYEEARSRTGIEKNLLTLWKARGEEIYGQLWKSPAEPSPPEIRLRHEWESLEAALVVGNVEVRQQQFYLSEISWAAVGRASLLMPPVREAPDIAALVPLYFRPFIPTRRKYGPSHSPATHR